MWVFDHCNLITNFWWHWLNTHSLGTWWWIIFLSVTGFILHRWVRYLVGLHRSVKEFIHWKLHIKQREHIFSGDLRQSNAILISLSVKLTGLQTQVPVDIIFISQQLTILKQLQPDVGECPFYLITRLMNHLTESSWPKSAKNRQTHTVSGIENTFESNRINNWINK